MAWRSSWWCALWIAAAAAAAAAVQEGRSGWVGAEQQEPFNKHKNSKWLLFWLMERKLPTNRQDEQSATHADFHR